MCAESVSLSGLDPGFWVHAGNAWAVDEADMEYSMNMTFAEDEGVLFRYMMQRLGAFNPAALERIVLETIET